MELGKWSKDIGGFENFDGILSLLEFEFVTQALLRLSSSFLSQLFLLMVDREEYMKLDVGKVVDHITRGSCISVKSGDDCSILFHNIRIGAYIDSDKTNLAYLFD